LNAAFVLPLVASPLRVEVSRREASMDRFRDEFELKERSVWLNTAHQGRLPRRAARALANAVQWKLHPEMLAASDRFLQVPSQLRWALARILGANEEDVVLANSASYGLHLIANGLDLGPGDEVLVPANDFPSDVLPWLMQRDRGVEVRMVKPQDEVLSAEEVEDALNERTRVVCLTWVHSFSGRVADLEGIGQLCRNRGCWFVVNGAQAVGARSTHVQSLPIDALVSVGFKWLCGPYGTGVCWLRPELYESLRPTKLYWLSALTADDLAAPSIDLESIAPERTGRLDIFGTANFFNYVPFLAALELLLELGMEDITDRVDSLVVRLLAGTDRTRYRLVSSEHVRSSLVVMEPLGEAADDVVARLLAAGVYVAHRRGRIRIAPHLYNTPEDIDRALDLL
jgi:selenocysteine lyase/cysteine desulfurase